MSKREPRLATIELQGLQDVVDEGPREHVRSAAERSLARLSREYRVDALRLHFKAHHVDHAGKTQYQVKAHLRTSGHAVSGMADAWDLVQATEAALQDLERQAATHKAGRVARMRAPRAVRAGNS